MFFVISSKYYHPNIIFIIEKNGKHHKNYIVGNRKINYGVSAGAGA